ncbi:MAG: DUF4149 domain-containing protein [Gammaproteobacteria bacterium]|nr:DUF4149 domain-containing protein [Gammaproteobacteria bacterium]
MIPRACLWSASERILLALWIGALWTVGLVVAPVLFAELDRHTAGTIAGILFRYLNFAGLCIGGFLLLRNRLSVARATAPAILLVLMLLSILINEFGFAPEIAALRGAGFAEGSEAAARFGRLHGAASVLYLINALFGVTLLAIWERQRRT